MKKLVHNTLVASDKKPNQKWDMNKEGDVKHRPSVVARLMGLDTFPEQPAPSKLLQKPVEKPSQKSEDRRKQKWQDVQAASLPVQRDERKQEKYILDRPRRLDNMATDHSCQSHGNRDVYELEQMKKELAVKQMVVRDKLTEAKRLLTGDKLSDKKWVKANEKLNGSKEFVEAVDFFQKNREAFLSYLDEHDSVLSKHLDELPGGPRQNQARNVVEANKTEETRRLIHREMRIPMQNRSPSADSLKSQIGNKVATRIVVLKPSPSKTLYSKVNEQRFVPSPDIKGLNGTANNPEVVTKRPVETRSHDLSGETEPPTANPREIAKEIARQVRENVVRELSKNAITSKEAKQNGSPEKFQNVVVNDVQIARDNRESNSRFNARWLDRSNGNIEGRPAKPKLKAPMDIIEQSQPRRPMRLLQKKSPASPEAARHASKGIVVLVPDQADRSKIGKYTEVHTSSRPASKHRDRIRKSHAGSDSDNQKVGDARKIKSRDNSACTSEESTNFRSAKSFDYSSDSGMTELQKQSTLNIIPAADDLKDDADSGSEGYSSNLRPSIEGLQANSSSIFISESDSGLKIQEMPQNTESVTESCTDDTASTERLESVTELQVPSETVEVSVGDSPVTAEETESSGHPSPVSVLESSFEESPRPVDFESISNELEELRMHLRLLKEQGRLDVSFGEPEIESPVVDKQVIELPQSTTTATTSTTTGTTSAIEDEVDVMLHKNNEDVPDVNDELQKLQWMSLEIGEIPCDEGKKQDQAYVKYLLIAAGFTSDCWTDNNQYSLNHALDPALFVQLEGYYRIMNPVESSAEEAEKKTCLLNRRLLFDVVDEILCKKMEGNTVCWNGGRTKVYEVWKRVCDYFYCYPKCEDLQETVENLIDRYLTRGDSWLEIERHVESLSTDLASDMLNELMEEAVEQLGLL